MNEADHNLPQIRQVLQEIGQTLFLEIRQLIESAKQRAAIAINAEITMLYWQVSHPSRNTPRSTRRIWQTNYCYPIPTTHPNLWQRLERYAIASSSPKYFPIATFCIHCLQNVAEYLTVLTPKELLQAKLQQAITSARQRLPKSEQN